MGTETHEHEWDRTEVRCLVAGVTIIHPGVACGCGTVIDLTCEGDSR